MPHNPLDLDWIRRAEIDPLTKGMPPTPAPLRHDQIGAQGWNILRQDLPFPTAVIRRDRMKANRAWMRAFLRETGVELCPHGKTTMSPELFALQIEDGAFGLSCATASHLEVYHRAGVRRVIMANQLIGHANVAMALRHLKDPDFDLYCIVDSRLGLQTLAGAARALGLMRPVNVLIEIGAAGARTGVRALVQAVDLANEAIGLTEIRIAGVETYEGVFAGPDPIQREAPITDLLDRAVAAAEAIATIVPANDEPLLLSAGGSDFFDLVVERFGRARLPKPARVVLRGGCYLTHDSLHYARCFERMRVRSPGITAIPGALGAALEVWSMVQSRPEPALAYCALGKRDISNDWEPPKPLFWFRAGLHRSPAAAPAEWRTRLLNDQHLHLELPEDAPLQVGDLIGFGVSHPCTTFDKWKLIPIVSENYDVIDAIRTFF